MSNIQEMFKYTGNLHDAVITKMNWSISDRLLELFIEDIECNYAGLAQYKGPRAVKLSLEHVSVSKFEFEFIDDKLKIYDFDISSTDNDLFNFVFTCSSNGMIKGKCLEPSFSSV